MRKAAFDEPLRWLKTNGHSLAPLTGQDSAALLAIAACWDLYALADGKGQEGALDAVRALLRGMQPKVRPLAKELVARSLDWSDRNRLWPMVELCEGCDGCAYEGGCYCAEDADPSETTGHAP